MASVNSFTVQRFLPITNPIRESKLLKSSSVSVKRLSGSSLQSFNKIEISTTSSFLRGKRRDWVIGSVADEIDVIPVKSTDLTDQQEVVIAQIDRERDGESLSNQVGGFANEGRLSFEGAGDLKGFSSSSSSSSSSDSLEGRAEDEEDISNFLDRAINATIVLAAGTFDVTKLLTINQDYWQESSDHHDFPLVSHLSIFSHGIKKLERVFVAVLIFIQILSPLPLAHLDQSFISPANAVLFSPDTKVPRTGELALRRAIPANKDMKVIQDSLEELSYLLRIPQRKPYGTMEGNVKKAIKIAKDEKQAILDSIPTDLREKGSVLYASLLDGKGGLLSLLEFIKEKDPDRVSVGLASSLDTIAELELLQAPGLSFLLPQQYSKYPRLAGRGTVEFTIEKGDGTTFSPTSGGEAKDQATIQVVIDGYSAPLTAGNFAKLVVDGAYNGVKLNCTTQAVLSDKDAKNNGYSVPLEIMPSGQFEPLYKTKLSVQDGELPVLPLSVYGAVAMAHNEDSEEFSSPIQFFFYLYDKSYSGLGGLSFDEGQFSVFGYTTVGREVLPQIKTGDVIRSAKLVEGQDRLILPNDQ